MAPLVLIDGPAGGGKGTLAKRLAEYLGYRHIDSGLLYRAVTSMVLETGGDPVDAARRLSEEDLKRTNLRSDAVNRKVPTVARIPEVRRAINERLREIIAEPPGTVMDGRAGAYEFPEAPVKIFLTASDEVRADRRCRQIREETGVDADYDYSEVLEEVRSRDKQDRERATSPLEKAEDAVEIDSSNLDADEVLSIALIICDEMAAELAR